MSKGPKTLTNTSSGTQTTAIDPTQAARQNQIWQMATGTQGQTAPVAPVAPTAPVAGSGGLLGGAFDKLHQQTYQTQLADYQKKLAEYNTQKTAFDAAPSTGVLNAPYQPYTGQRFEDFTPDQLASFDAARAAAGAGTGAVNQAVDTSGILSQFMPPGVTSRDITGPEMVPTGGAAGFTPGSIHARDVTAQAGPGGYQAYMNPYENDVVGASLSDLERSRAEAISAGGASAAAAHAFGGSRHGVSDALTNRSFAQTAAQTAAGLRSVGFNTALGYNQADQNRNLSGQQSNQGADVATGTANLGAQTQAGIANNQNLLTGYLANQAAGSRFREFNASNALDASKANATNAIAGGGLRLGAAGQLGQLGAQQQAMGAQGADLLSRIGGQQQAFGQAGKDFGYQQFNEAKNLPIQQLDLLSRLLGGQQYGSSTTSSQTNTQPNPNRGSLFGTISGLAGLLPGVGGLAKAGLGLLGGGGPDWSSPEYAGAQ